MARESHQVERRGSGSDSRDQSTTPSRRALSTFIPILGWLPTYSRKLLRGDIIAGITLVGLAVPESLGYAQIAGVPVQFGLYALLGGLVGYLLFGASRQLVVGPSAGLAAISAATLATLTSGSGDKYLALSAGLALIVGVIAVLCGVSRLGFVAQFLSEPVLTGFIFGLAASIAMRQAPKLFGVQGGDGDFFERLWQLITHLGETNGWTLVIGVASLALLFGLKHFAPRVPESLVALAFGIIVVALFGLERQGVAIIGPIPSGLPHIGIPALSLGDIGALASGAVGLTLVAYVEHIGAASAFAAKRHDEVRPNQELIGLGVANLAAGLCQGFVVGGSLSKTAANDAAGAGSQMSGLTAAVLTVLTMLFLTPLFQDLPEATLGAVVIAAVWGLMKVSALQRYWRLRRTDFILAGTALAGELVFDVLPGLLIAVVLSLLLLIYRASRPNLSELGRIPGQIDFEDMQRSPEARSIADLLLIRPNEGIFFANATALRTRIIALTHARRPAPQAVVLDLEETGELDVPGVDMLRELYEELHREGIALLLVRVHYPVRAMLDRSGITERIGADHVYPRALAAVRESLLEAGDEGAAELRTLFVDAAQQMCEMTRQRASHASEPERLQLAEASQKLEDIVQTFSDASANVSQDGIAQHRA